MSNAIVIKSNNQKPCEFETLIAKSKHLGALADRLMEKFMVQSIGEDKSTQQIMFKKTLIHMVVVSKLLLRVLFEMKSQISNLINIISRLDETVIKKYEKQQASLIEIESIIQRYITNQRNNLNYLNRLMRKRYKVKLSANEVCTILSISYSDYINSGKKIDQVFVSLRELAAINDEPICQILKKVR